MDVKYITQKGYMYTEREVRSMYHYALSSGAIDKDVPYSRYIEDRLNRNGTLMLIDSIEDSEACFVVHCHDSHGCYVIETDDCFNRYWNQA